MTRTARLISEISQEEIDTLTGPRVWPSHSAERASDRFIHRRPEIPFIIARKNLLEDFEHGKDGVDLPILTVRMILLEKGQGFVKGSAHTMNMMLQGESDINDVKLFLKTLRKNLQKHIEREARIFRDSVRLDFFKKKSRRILSWQEKWL